MVFSPITIFRFCAIASRTSASATNSAATAAAAGEAGEAGEAGATGDAGDAGVIPRDARNASMRDESAAALMPGVSGFAGAFGRLLALGSFTGCVSHARRLMFSR